jgi:hypothetical protein
MKVAGALGDASWDVPADREVLETVPLGQFRVT